MSEKIDRTIRRRKFLKATGAGGIAALGFTSTGSADYSTNDSQDYRDLNLYVYRDSSTDGTSVFAKGAISGAHDFAEWLSSWFPYVNEVNSYDYLDTGWSSLELDTHGTNPNDFRDEIPDYRQGPEDMNIVVINDPDTFLGQARGNLYEDGGIVTYVNENHIHSNAGAATGNLHGYNIAIHELIHGMTFHSDTTGGYRADHSLGSPDVSDGWFTAQNTSIMGTGYGTTLKTGEDDKELPYRDCFGDSWRDQQEKISPSPVRKVTKCTCKELYSYHMGDWTAEPTGDYEDLTSIPGNQNPWR